MLRTLKTALVAVLLLSPAVAVYYQQPIIDWWRLQNYQPSAAIVELADSAAMSDDGRRYFYLSDPQVNDKEEFAQNCPVHEKAFVLGCYSAQRIFLLEVDRQELEGIMEVTAAHEMLHAAYERLSNREREQVVELLEADFAAVTDQNLIRLIERYEESGGLEARQDELHSILPTQVADLSPELEEYFSRYFTDRQQVVALFRQYEGTFLSLREQIDTLQGHIGSLRGEIGQIESDIATEGQRVDTLNRQLDEHEADGDTEAYNALVPEQNQAVARYNRLIERYRELIARHNRTVEELNEIVLLQNELVNSLDARHQPL